MLESHENDNAPSPARNPIAKAVRTPLYKMRVVENKRKKLLNKWSEAVLKDTNERAIGDKNESD